jgi:competence protein ComGC
MRRLKPEPSAQPEPLAHAPRWKEITLLVAYLVIFALSILTVLVPTTDNQEEHVEKKTASAEGTGNVPK